ncbi:MAG: sulfatase [Thermoanaerobaculia bacterium]
MGRPLRVAVRRGNLSIGGSRSLALRAFAACALTVGVVGAATFLAGCADEQPRPDIILVSIDSLRADNLGCYGYPRETSPFVDQLASEGVRFENAISTTSWTLPSHAALFSGLYDSTHGLVSDDQRLAKGVLTIAEVLRDGGYHTAGFYGGPFLHPTFGLDQGFDVYRSCMAGTGGLESGQDVRRGLELDRVPSHADVTSPRTLEEVTSWAESGVEGPYFLFLHLWDVHYDYIPPQGYVELFDPDYEGDLTGESLTTNPAISQQMARRDLEHLIALYDGEIRFTDDHLRLIFEALDRRGLLDNALTVITADHGEEFFEHGGKGHRRTLFDEMIRVPLIVHWPGHVSSGTVVGNQVRLIDIMPTLAAAAGLAGDLETQGRDLSPLFRGADLAAVPSLSELTVDGHSLRALRTENQKLLQRDDAVPGWFYQLDTDRREMKPILIDEVAGPMQAEVAKALELGSRLGLDSSDAVDLDDDLRERLEALGYLDN